MEMKEVVREYNSLVSIYFSNDKDHLPVKSFPSMEIALAALNELKAEIFVPPTQSDLTPINKGTNHVNVQPADTLCTRAEAVENGYILYWTGNPCSHGHWSVRYTKSGHCKKCYQLFRAESMQQCDICKDRLTERKKRGRKKREKDNTTLATYVKPPTRRKAS
jgi:hypothetical protein